MKFPWDMTFMEIAHFVSHKTNTYIKTHNAKELEMPETTSNPNIKEQAQSQEGTVLIGSEIKRHRDLGNIIINPFDAAMLKTGSTSYDVRLGMNYYSEQTPEEVEFPIFNPFDREHIQKYWGDPRKAERYGKWRQNNSHLNRLHDRDYIIVIKAGNTILAHTIEFIGGANCVATEMRARSSIGRIGITVCKCASKGDVGFFNRWTMEITNQMKATPVVLVVGMRIAQIIFYRTTPVEVGNQYGERERTYQSSSDLQSVIDSWTPDLMLPRLHEDPDIDRFREFAEASKHPERILK